MSKRDQPVKDLQIQDGKIKYRNGIICSYNKRRWNVSETGMRRRRANDKMINAERNHEKNIHSLV